MSAPLVSVFVISYNHERFIEEALESLRSQTCSDFETLIIDDASSDRTGDVIEGWLRRTGYAATFVRNAQNRGICRNRNTALSLTSGRFICSLSGDDAYEPDRIARQLACFLEQPDETAAVYSDAVTVDGEGRRVNSSFLEAVLNGEPPPQGRLFCRILRHNFICAPATMLRRTALEAVGGYDETLSYEDFDMWLRLTRQFNFVHVPGCLVRYRVLPSSMSRSAAGRRFMRVSDQRILDRWLTCALEPSERQAVIDAVWRTAKEHLYYYEDTEARSRFVTAARADGGLSRHVIAGLLHLPGACASVRVAAGVYRSLRGHISTTSKSRADG